MRVRVDLAKLSLQESLFSLDAFFRKAVLVVSDQVVRMQEKVRII